MNANYEEIPENEVLIRVSSWVLHPDINCSEGHGTVVRSANSWRLHGKKVAFIKLGASISEEFVTVPSKACLSTRNQALHLIRPLTALMICESATYQKNSKIVHISDDFVLNRMIDKISTNLGKSIENVSSNKADEILSMISAKIVMIGDTEFPFMSFGRLVEDSQTIVYGNLKGLGKINASDLIYSGKKIKGQWVYSWFMGLPFLHRYRILHLIQDNEDVFAESGENFDRLEISCRMNLSDFRVYEKQSVKANAVKRVFEPEKAQICDEETKGEENDRNNLKMSVKIEAKIKILSCKSSEDSNPCIELQLKYIDLLT
jgi:hypothetical protein